MPTASDDDLLGDLCHAATLLREPTRLRILALLDRGPRSSGALTDALGIGQSQVSRHLGLLRLGGFVASERRGKSIYHALSPEGFGLVLGFVALMSGLRRRRKRVGKG